MLSVKYLETEIAKFNSRINALNKSALYSGEEIKATIPHLQRLKEAYEIELAKAYKRPEKRIAYYDDEPEIFDYFIRDGRFV